MKRIYVSALSARSGGGVTYLENILPLFPSDKNVECHVIASSKFKLPINCGDNVFLHTLPSWMNNPFCRFFITKLYLKLIFFLGKKIDVIYYPGGSIDIPCDKNVTSIVAFRNMLPFDKVEAARYPFGYIRIRNWLLFYMQRAAFKRADKIIFISKYAKSIMKKHVINVEEKSTVIYHGIENNISKSNESDLHEKIAEDYVLYVSNIDVYKAQLEVIQAWAKYKVQRPGKVKLLLVGAEYKPYGKKVKKLIKSLNLTSEVILVGNLDRSELPTLYEKSLLNIYASSCENCPNILLEILASGSPVICSNYQPMPEIGGGDLIYFDPYNIDELANKLFDILSNIKKREEMSLISKERSTHYSWEKTSEETWSYVIDSIKS